MTDDLRPYIDQLDTVPETKMADKPCLVCGIHKSVHGEIPGDHDWTDVGLPAAPKTVERPYKILIDFTINGEYRSEPVACWVNHLDEIHINLPIKASFAPMAPQLEASNEAEDQ